MHVVIVGASVAGLRSAEGLRQLGFEGRITMIGDEEHSPYDRPPLSKKVLRDTVQFNEIALRDPDGMAELDVDLLLGLRATRLDLEGHRVITENEVAIAFDHVIVATGARARRMESFQDAGSAFVLRTFEDATAIRSAMDQATSVVVVGGGFIGSEVASAACSRGLQTTVLEMEAAPLGRALGGLVGARLGQFHADHGSALRCGVKVVGPTDVDGSSGVLLSDGSAIDADVVFIGIGSVP